MSDDHPAHHWDSVLARIAEVERVGLRVTGVRLSDDEIDDLRERTHQAATLFGFPVRRRCSHR